MTLTLLAAVLLSASPSPRFVVHEWGTFTSIAGRDGVELDWRPLSGDSDLPTFVHTEARPGPTRFEGRPSRGKGESGTMRMETPVVYFYADAEMEASLHVGFVGGRMTEWYPHARTVANSDAYSYIDWGRFKVVPGYPDSAYLREAAPSHYYPARNTDAAGVVACGQHKTEADKFLFYRGVGKTQLPLLATLRGNAVDVRFREPPKERARVIVFERQGASAGFTVGNVGGAVQRPELTGKPEDVYAPLRELLLAEGLYAKEADAMLETWKDSWFEDGLRVFYVLPRSETERILPMSISPAPTELVRVMVGRVELFTEQMRADAKRLTREQADLKYGRFAEVMRSTR